MNYYVDIHSNLLPELAGLGNRPMTETEASARISELQESNIKHAVAAPFFDPAAMSAADFLALRDEKLAAIPEGAAPMHILGGAVIPFAYAVSHPKELQQFAVGESAYFLIDLSAEPVTSALCEDLSRLRIVSGMCPIAADADRLFDFWTPEDWIALKQAGILLQISVNGLLRQEHRKLTLYLLANEYAHFVATGSREVDQPLHFADAMRILQRSLPTQNYRRVKNNAGMLLSNAEPSAFL